MKDNNIIFLSHSYSGDTPSYGNRDRFISSINSSIKNGDTANTSCWVFTNNHLGTHIDVPYHFNENGLKVTDYAPSSWVFYNIGFIELPCNNSVLIGKSDLEKFDLDKNIDLLLIRTNYEKYRGQNKYWNDNPGISPDIPKYLRENYLKLRCIGFDFISITSWKYRSEGRFSHKLLLSPDYGDRPILAIEDMSLSRVNSNLDWVVVAPLLVEEANGSPVTVVAKLK